MQAKSHQTKSYRLAVGVTAVLAMLATACGASSGIDVIDSAVEETVEAPTATPPPLLPPTEEPTQAPPAAAPVDLSLSEIDFETGSISIVNNGTADVDLSKIWICEFPVYFELDAGVLTPGQSVKLDNPIASDRADGELALYSSDSFDDPTAILAYVEWGAGGHERASVAQTAGLWAGSPLAPAAKFQSKPGAAGAPPVWSSVQPVPTATLVPPATTAPATPVPATAVPATPVPPAATAVPPTPVPPAATAVPPTPVPPAPTAAPPDGY